MKGAKSNLLYLNAGSFKVPAFVVIELLKGCETEKSVYLTKCKFFDETIDALSRTFLTFQRKAWGEKGFVTR